MLLRRDKFATLTEATSTLHPPPRPNYFIRQNHTSVTIHILRVHKPGGSNESNPPTSTSPREIFKIPQTPCIGGETKRKFTKIWVLCMDKISIICSDHSRHARKRSNLLGWPHPSHGPLKKRYIYIYSNTNHF